MKEQKKAILVTSFFFNSNSFSVCEWNLFSPVWLFDMCSKVMKTRETHSIEISKLTCFCISKSFMKIELKQTAQKDRIRLWNSSDIPFLLFSSSVNYCFVILVIISLIFPLINFPLVFVLTSFLLLLSLFLFYSLHNFLSYSSFIYFYFLR